jgi:hypothetical protein
MKTLEFNSVRTIKTINKDGMLKKVYNGKCEDFNFTKLLTAAESNTLADKAIETLKDIFDTIVVGSDEHVEIYNAVEVKTKTPRRYGKNQINIDIETQGGVPTSAQESMLLLGDLKAMTSTLLNRGVSDRYKGTTNFSDADHRKIKSAIRELKKSLAPVLKSK